MLFLVGTIHPAPRGKERGSASEPPVAGAAVLPNRHCSWAGETPPSVLVRRKRKDSHSLHLSVEVPSAILMKPLSCQSSVNGQQPCRWDGSHRRRRRREQQLTKNITIKLAPLLSSSSPFYVEEYTKHRIANVPNGGGNHRQTGFVYELDGKASFGNRKGTKRFAASLFNLWKVVQDLFTRRRRNIFDLPSVV